MKKILFVSMIAIILLMNLVFINAEVTFWTDTLIQPSINTVDQHSFYEFDDTSAKGVGQHKAIPININYVVQSLPYNLTFGQVDYCNLTIITFQNTYSDTSYAITPISISPIATNPTGILTATLLNTSTNEQSFYFSNQSLVSGMILANMKDKDTLTIDMICHYTDIQSLYQENVLVGSFTTFFPQFACDECSQYTVQELSDQLGSSDNITLSSSKIYDKVQYVVSFSWQIWLIISWLIKISLVIVAVALIFSGIYYIYKYLTDLGNTIK